MPDGCSAKLLTVPTVTCSLRPNDIDSIGSICMLVYAGDMALMSGYMAELVLMLQSMGKISHDTGLCVNASKTELLALQPPYT